MSGRGGRGTIVPRAAVAWLAIAALAVLARAAPAAPGATWLALPGAAGPVRALVDARRDGEPRGAVLLVPAFGRRPGDPGATAALRGELSAHGWDVLVLEAPAFGDPRAEPAHSEWMAAAAAGLEALRRHVIAGGARVVVVGGLGFGAGAAQSWVEAAKRERVRALVAVNPAMPAPAAAPGAVRARLTHLAVPLLDVVTDDATRETRDLVGRRARAARREGRAYRRVRLVTAGTDPGAGGAALARAVRGWLRTTLSPEATSPAASPRSAGGPGASGRPAPTTRARP